MKRKAVYAGSFDMPTNGHKSIIEKASKLFDELTVSIGVNPLKKCMYSLEDRLEMLEKLAESYQNVSVSCFNTNTFLVNYAESIGASFIVRGIRNIEDFSQEQTMCEKNRIINPNIETVFLMAEHKYSNVSSSTVKLIIGPDGWEDVVKHDIPEKIWNVFLKLTKEIINAKVRAKS